eukprot:GHVP01002196.1.p1 GENE.GHVP01002196.1~~GHVP01002196.1.p1  ORF type:complete len:754 (+),score=140.41 GHVP01002196.1:343-2604(+)
MFEHSTELRKLVTLVDELRDAGVAKYIRLPRIAVVGTQSAGKSSVLESIVGLDFLPRGDGVVTRRPLELRLVHSDCEATAVFEDDGESESITDFAYVKQRIAEKTDEKAGSNKGIVDVPIVLTIFAKSCPDLTLVDLPGVTRVPLKNSDQTDDIEMVTREMATRYAKDPRTIILAVVPANVDISTSDALQISRAVDPQGVRTVGVVTKIDLMEQGTDASRMLNGDDIHLRLGFVGVRNRGTKDVASAKSIISALEDEDEYFNNHPIYRRMNKELLGTRNLVSKLTTVLYKHIKKDLPQIKRELTEQQQEWMDKEERIGRGVPLEKSSRDHFIWILVNDFTEIFSNTIRGKFDTRIDRYGIRAETVSGAEIRTIFYSLLIEESERQITDEISDEIIDKAVKNHEGDNLPGFPSADTFEHLLRPYLNQLPSPVFDCLDQIQEKIINFNFYISKSVFGRFPTLEEEITVGATEITNREYEKTKDILSSIVEAQISYLFTNDPGYLNAHASFIGSEPSSPESQRKIPEVVSERSEQRRITPDGYVQESINDTTTYSSQLIGAAGNLGSKFSNLAYGAKESVRNLGRAKTSIYNNHFLRELRKRLDAYFLLIVRNLRDIVPKIIGTFFVRKVQQSFKYEIIERLRAIEDHSVLLDEPFSIKQEREYIRDGLAVVRRALSIINREPKFARQDFDDFHYAPEQLKMEDGNQDFAGAQQQAQPSPILTENIRNFEETKQRKKGEGLFPKAKKIEDPLRVVL